MYNLFTVPRQNRIGIRITTALLDPTSNQKILNYLAKSLRVPPTALSVVTVSIH